jgi:PucR-like helix-turn-helix protein
MSIDRVRSVLDGIAATLGCPIVLDDERQRLLAHTGHDVTADGVRVASILARGATPEIRTWFEQWGILEATDPVRTPADRGRQIAPRWVVPLRHQGVLLGFVSVLDHGRLTRDDLAPVLESAAAIAEALYVARRAEPRVAALLELLVLPQRSGPGDDVTLDIAAMYPHTGPIAVVTFARRGAAVVPDAVPELLAAVRHACRAFPARTALYAAIEGAVVALVPAGPDRAVTAATRLAASVVAGTTEIAGIVAGVSSAEWDASSAAAAYSESVRALRIPLADATAEAISCWDRAGAFRALTLLPAAGAVDPIDPRVRALLAQPQLARTVEAFLDRAGDAGATAQQLRIHRATLYQRLARVRELCALDIQRSGDDRLTAHVGLRLAMLAHGRPGAPSSPDARRANRGNRA